MDEPASAMDATSEAIFIANMKSYLHDKTLVLGTHRTTLLPLVERLIVIRDGRVVADGPRDKVLEALTKASRENLS